MSAFLTITSMWLRLFHKSRITYLCHLSLSKTSSSDSHRYAFIQLGAEFALQFPAADICVCHLSCVFAGVKKIRYAYIECYYVGQKQRRGENCFWSPVKYIYSRFDIFILKRELWIGGTDNWSRLRRTVASRVVAHQISRIIFSIQVNHFTQVRNKKAELLPSC